MAADCYGGGTFVVGCRNTTGRVAIPSRLRVRVLAVREPASVMKSNWCKRLRFRLLAPEIEYHFTRERRGFAITSPLAINNASAFENSARWLR
ncbi:hypothetical protein KCP77_00185 [Salmonella enterica subsp. enterica]|nr:hypothetical protein KCP77_00185 [Salmonella enterica subsp. enterica]